MQALKDVAPAFIKMAHQIVWCTVATVDKSGRPRSRILHPIWLWENGVLTGWIATGPTPIKRANLEHSSYLSANYWAPSHDTCVAECHASWAFDDATREYVWDLFKRGPAPVGYDPGLIPAWESATSPTFAALKLEPWRLRVFPGSVLMQQGGEVLTWNA